MTSSWTLKKRREMRDPDGKLTWGIDKFADLKRDSLGGWEDHYIINGAHRVCHPDFEAVSIGNPYGFAVCRRRRVKNCKGQTRNLDQVINPIDPSIWNGYHKFKPDLYRPWRNTQIQMYDPYWYQDRTTPFERGLTQKDYYNRGTKYDGIGVKMTRTPMRDGTHVMQFGYDYTPGGPPPKYDVQFLHQPYPSWKTEQEWTGLVSKPELEKLDTTYEKRVV